MHPSCKNTNGLRWLGFNLGLLFLCCSVIACESSESNTLVSAGETDIKGHWKQPQDDKTSSKKSAPSSLQRMAESDSSSATPSTTPSQLTVLLYHHIAEDTPRATSTTPDEFAAHLNYLKDNEFTVVPLKQGLDRLFSGQPLPPKAVAITFDDGYRSIYQTAWPMLKQFDYPFTLFVDTRSIDLGFSSMMSWDELRELHRAGVTIANHSVTHPHMLGLSLEQAAEEIDRAQNRLIEQLGEVPRLFAYPYGEYNLPLAELLQARGYYGLAQFSGPASIHSHPQAIPRFSFSGNYAEITQFGLKVNTRAMPVQSVSPADPHQKYPPRELSLKLHNLPFNPQQMNCFYLGKPVSNLEWFQFTATIKLESLPSPGRSRVNCTAPTGVNQQYYWQTIPLFVEPSDGRWPD